MRSLLPVLKEWLGRGESVAIARVVSTWGSAPRLPGAALLVSGSGALAGSVSGGCIEGAVRDVALGVLRGEPARIVEFGVDNETAWSVGLSCGGTVRVLVQPFPGSIGPELIRCVQDGIPAVWTTQLSPQGVCNSIATAVDVHGDDEAPSFQPNSMTDEVRLNERDGDTLFVQRFDAPPRVVIVGGADIAVHLVGMAHDLDFDTILIDPRAVFTDADRFPVAPTRLETAWPQEILPELRLDGRAYAVMLTHDPKIDDPAIGLLLDSGVAYIGALGGRKTQQARRERLREAGYNEERIGFIRGPVGLDIGAATPGEIALSIMAEIIQVHRGEH